MLLLMADAVAIGFQLLFRKPGYRVVELTEYCGTFMHSHALWVS